MWFFWWNGRSGGARFFWMMFFIFMMINVLPVLFRTAGFATLFLFAFIGFIVINTIRNAGTSSTSIPDSRRTYWRDDEEMHNPRRIVVPHRPYQQEQSSVAVHDDKPHDHALRAARAVGIDPDTAQIVPIDVGVIAYYRDETTVHRLWQIDADTDALQPFVNLRVRRMARGMLRFEIRDSHDELCFLYEREYNLSFGSNLIMPPARMPVDKSADKMGHWTLRVLGDGLPLVEHRFTWQSQDGDNLGAHIGEDGEISDELRMMMARARLDRMSLDELLGDEDDSAKKRHS